MRIPYLLTVTLMLAACAPVDPPIALHKRSSGSSVITHSGSDADAPNEATPKTTDSLEVATVTGALVASYLATNDSIFVNSNRCCESSDLFLQEFFDYDCPYCREYALTARPWIDDEYVATSKIGIERIFAPQTAWGRRLALAALCAADQKKFDPLDALLIAQFPASESALLVHVKTAGLNRKTYDVCMQNNTRIPEVRTLSDGSVIKRVPSFRLGEDSWQGVLDRESLQKQIEGSL